MRTSVVLALMAVTAAAFVVGSHSDGTLERDRQAATSPPKAAAPSAAAERPRVFSAKQPLLISPHLEDFEPVEVAASPSVARRWATVTAAAKDEAPPPASAVVRGSRLTSLKPGDEDARAQLVRDIQYELKRTGCYSGEVNGSWTGSTRQAMQHFTDRVNARLPLGQPDYVLLALLQNERPNFCSSHCPEGQLAAEDGRCPPRALTAQRRDSRGAIGVAVPTQDVMARGSSQLPPVEPLPGRMAVGAPADAVEPGSSLAAVGDARAIVENPDAEQADTPQAARATPAKPRPRVQRGSTRQVFSKLMQTAP